ncbi:MAG: hypothetical protein GEV05_28260 [Betaproteobacteria bacterium]|nr:hypothetical protein [Betaproteobacteria bacterium]
MLLRSMAVAVAVAFALAPAYAQQNGKSKDKVKSKRVVQGPKQRHQCKVGPYEKQTRLVMETVKNKPVYIAYWSSSGPFHCSFESWPGDGRAQWVDSKAGTVINLIKGTMRIERNGDKYYIHANEVDRMPYCGTFGLITGVMTVPTKKGRPCDWQDMSEDDGNVLKQKETPADAEPAPALQDAAPAETGPSAGSDAAGPIGLADPG